MRFGVLGPLVAWTADGRLVRIPELKVRALLADLLIHEGRLVSADRLAYDLWGDSMPGGVTNTLQTKISQLRRVLERAEPGGRDLVAYQAPGYYLRVDDDAVDAIQFEALAAAARATDDLRHRAPLLSDALALWRGPAYVEFRDEEFARTAVARLEELRLVVLEEWAEARLQRGEHGLVAAELSEQVAQNPLRERLRAAHVRALYGAGRQTDALASLDELRDRLREDLGLDPSAELAGLHQAILRQDPSLQRIPSPAPAATLRTNLPTPLTELIGRAETIAVVLSLLQSARLVTLTGPGGVGKTRLAIETAKQLVDILPDGPWLIELTTVSANSNVEAQSSEIVELITTVLGIRDEPAHEVESGTPTPDLTGRLIHAIRARRLLLVLDNCEHVVDAVARLAALLLASAPELRILSTSQEPLGISGETVWLVPPLGLPELTSETDPASLLRSSAVQLFVSRASAADPTFHVDTANASAVAAICRGLDGVPLALELAATRAPALGVRVLANRLDDRFRVLSSQNRGAPARQRTLRAVIDWSWGLLGDAERVVLRRLAAHSDGCTLEAAEAVCAGDGIEPPDVLELITRLVDRSLVAVTDTSTGPRYRLLESVAAYCVERMDEVGEHERVCERHSQYYVGFAERANIHLRGHSQRHWLQRLDVETANLRTALAAAAQRADAGLALRLVEAMAWYWFLRGRLTEARRSVDVALDVDGGTSINRTIVEAWRVALAIMAGDTINQVARGSRVLSDFDDPAVRAWAEWLLGFAASDFGDLSYSEDLVSRAQITFDTVGDRWGAAAAMSTRAKHAAVRGDLGAQEHNAEHSYALFRELGDGWGQLQATEWLGELAEIHGDYDRARELHSDALRMAEELGLWPQAADRLSWLGRTAMLNGNLPEARNQLERALRLAREHGYKPGEIFADIGLGLLARREGRLDLAESHLQDVLEWHRRMNHEPGVAHAMVLTELGFIAEQRGHADAAQALHVDGFDVAWSLGDLRAAALAIEGMAGAQARAGRHQYAARLLGAAAAARRSNGTPLPESEKGDVNRITNAVRTALGEEIMAIEFERGAQMSLDEVRASVLP